MKAPDKNKNGLVVPPEPVRIDERLAERYGERSKPDRHHLYFPRIEFQERGKLAHDFREHRFNSIWLPRFQHERLHKRYDRLIRAHPGYLVPSDEVMVTFLDEAHLLDELQVCVRAIEMMNDALYEGTVVKIDRTLENRQMRVESINDVVRRTANFEVITPQISRIAIEGAQRVMLSAA